MITDEERRQIACRLHEEAENWRDFAKDDTLFDMCDATFVESVLSAFQLNDMDMHVCEAFDKLADFIDRPKCRNVSGYKDIFECSECRCKVEIVGEEGNDYGDVFSTPFMPRYCPSCGAGVVE